MKFFQFLAHAYLYYRAKQAMADFIHKGDMGALVRYEHYAGRANAIRNTSPVKPT